MIGCPSCGKSEQSWWPTYTICKACSAEVKSPPEGIDWVITGGESGAKARPSHPDWFRSLRDQCAAADVPFHFKQWGEHLPFTEVRTSDQKEAFRKATIAGNQSYFGARSVNGPQGLMTGTTSGVAPVSFAKIGKKKAGRLLDGVLHDAFPEVEVKS